MGMEGFVQVDEGADEDFQQSVQVCLGNAIIN